MDDRRAPILVRRYGGRRLYDGSARRYVTVADLLAWRASGIDVVVIDAETGADVTRELLA